MDTNTLVVSDIAQIFSIPDQWLNRQEIPILTYNNVTSEEQVNIIETTKIIVRDSARLTVGEGRQAHWEERWTNLKDTLDGDFLEYLKPPYYTHVEEVLRLNGDYIRAITPEFEWLVSKIFRKWLFETYFIDQDTICEFGCGSAYNLGMLAHMYPTKTYYGFDWTAASSDIIIRLRDQYSWNISGFCLDMFNPDYSVEIPEGSGVLLFHSMEQLGENYEAMIAFLLKKNPAIVVHVDGMYEWYSSTSFDLIAKSYHQHRNYLRGYISYLQSLSNEGIVEILAEHRTPFGNKYHDAYSYIIWKPI